MGSNSHRQTKVFENALAKYDKDTPDRWQNIANATGKTVEEVIRQYQLLLQDLQQIESGNVPLPNYKTSSTAPTVVINHQRLKFLKRQ